MVKEYIDVIGFPKCGTMSFAVYVKNIYSGRKIIRSEDIWNTAKKNNDAIFTVITRNPIDRIKSAIQYWPAIKKRYDEEGMEGVLKGFKNYQQVGMEHPIEQSNYSKYIKDFEDLNDCKIEVYRFEDLIKEKIFPHINESEVKIKLTKDDIDLIKARLEIAKIEY